MKDYINKECAFVTDNPNIFALESGHTFEFIHGYESKSPLVKFTGINKKVKQAMSEDWLFPENMTYLGSASVLTVDGRLEFEY